MAFKRRVLFKPWSVPYSRWKGREGKLSENQYAGKFFQFRGELDGDVGRMSKEWDFDFHAFMADIDEEK